MEKPMTQIEEAMYARCMSEAARLANETAQRLGPFGTGRSLAIVNPWVDLWTAYSAGKLTEEDVKSCFLLGYVTESCRAQFPIKQTGCIPVNNLPRRRMCWGEVNTGG